MEGRPIRKKTSLTDSKNTRQDILDIAAKLFSQRGYNGTPLRDIADAVNMKAGSLYYHFDSKEQMVLEVFTLGIESIHNTVLERVKVLAKNSPTRSILVAAATGHLEALLEKGDYSSTSIRNFGQMPEPIKSKVMVIRDKYESLWRDWLSEGLRNGEIKEGIDLSIFRLTVLGALNRTLEWYRPGKHSVEQIAEMQIGFFWDGIANKKV